MQKVMLAEDDDTMVSLLKTLLTMEGYQVVTLLDKKGDLLENIRLEKPDVLLLDVHLGDWDGLDIVKKIKQTPDLKAVKVVMTSGSDKNEACFSAGADDFLLKPYMPDDLIRKLGS